MLLSCHRVGLAASGTISRMTLPPRARRHLLWLAACLIAFKAIVPAVAVAASQWRGVDLIEVCTVFGVRTLAVSLEGSGAPASHGDDHPAAVAEMAGCGLVGLALSAPPDAQTGPAWQAATWGLELASGCEERSLPPDRVRGWLEHLTLAPPGSSA